MRLLRTCFSISAGMQLVGLGVVFLLLPAMAVLALELEFATFPVHIYLLVVVPVLTLLVGVEREVRLAAVVLPVVSEHALGSFVGAIFFVEVVWAPCRLEVKHVEV